MEDKVRTIDIRDIEFEKYPVRQYCPEEKLKELANSIKRHGLLQPVVLLGKPKHPPYHLISGKRRLLAHEMLKRKTIRAVFSSVKDEKVKLCSLIENIQSDPLTYVDISKAITELFMAYGKDERKIQRETGLPLDKIRDYVNIEAQMSEKMRERLRKRKVTRSDVKRAIRAAHGKTEKAEELLDLMEEYKLTQYHKKRIIECAQKTRTLSAKRIIDEATRPRTETKLMVSLPEEVHKGLEKAIVTLSKEAEEIVAEVFQDWLSVQGFMDSDEHN